MSTFNYGKYRGKTHKFVCAIDPGYIIYVYENHHDNGGISNEMYRLAEIIIQEAAEDDDLGPEDFQDDLPPYDAATATGMYDHDDSN